MNYNYIIKRKNHVTCSCICMKKELNSTFFYIIHVANLYIYIYIYISGLDGLGEEFEKD